MKPNYNAPINPYVATASCAISAMNSNQVRIDFGPSADDVARKVYINHGNQRLGPDDELQLWLEAEAQLLLEDNATQVYSSPNRPLMQMCRATQNGRISL